MSSQASESVGSSVSSLTSSSSAFTLNTANEVLSVLQPLGYSSSTCGYCSSTSVPAGSGDSTTTAASAKARTEAIQTGKRTKWKAKPHKSGRSYGCWAHALSCSTYKYLIDHGWRRSGKYLYKPDMRSTCCPQYTITLDVESFTPSKSQRQLLNRFSNFIIYGDHEGKPGWGPTKGKQVNMGGDEGEKENGGKEVRGQGGTKVKGGDRSRPSTSSQPQGPNVKSSLNAKVALSERQLEKEREHLEETEDEEMNINASKNTAARTDYNKPIKADSLLTVAKTVTFDPPLQPAINNPEDSEQRPMSSSKKKKRKAHLLRHGSSNSENQKNNIPPAIEDQKSKSPDGLSFRTGHKSGKGKANTSPIDLIDLIHNPESCQNFSSLLFKHNFEYVLEPASFTQEKYELFRLYQTQIHGEPDSKVTPKGFTRFLVDSPLEPEPTLLHPSHPYHYGSFHGKYILDGELIAFAVLDVLPGAVSSVYFVWSPAYGAMGLGKVSALREAAMVKEMNRDGLEDMTDYMMGFYIHTCPKMKYKAEYQPSSLLDPDTNTFYPWEQCKAALDKCTHASFSHPPNTNAIPIPGTSSNGSGWPTHRHPHNQVTVLNSAAPSSSGGRNKQSQDDDLMEEEHRQDKDLNKDLASSCEEDESEESDQDVVKESDDDDDVEWPTMPPPGCLDPSALPKSLLLGTCILEGKTLVPLMFSSAWHDRQTESEIRQCLAALGEGCTGRVALWTPRSEY